MQRHILMKIVSLTFIFTFLIIGFGTDTVLAAETDIVDDAERLKPVVEELRGLQFLYDLPVELVTGEEITEIIQAELDIQLDEETDRKFSSLYTLLGLLPRQASLRAGYEQMVEEQVAGLYDPSEKKFYVVDVDLGDMMGSMLGGGDDPISSFFSGLAEGFLEGMGLDMRSTIMVHEMVHALDDQHFDIEGNMDELMELQSDDMQLAYQSLVEGNATMLMNDFMFTSMGMDPSQMQGMGAANMELAEAMLDYSPFLERIMMVPYLKGEEFVRHLVNQGGRGAVDDAFIDPPVSMEQILHPSRYTGRRDDPGFIADPDLSSVLTDWEHEASDTLGELITGLVFELQTGDRTGSEDIADGWDGDRVTSWRSPEGTLALVWVTTWDSIRDAEDFFDAYRDLLELKYPGGVWEVDTPDRLVYTGLGLAATAELDGRDVVIIEGVPDYLVDECLSAAWETQMIYD